MSTSISVPSSSSQSSYLSSLGRTRQARSRTRQGRTSDEILEDLANIPLREAFDRFLETEQGRVVREQENYAIIGESSHQNHTFCLWVVLSWPDHAERTMKHSFVVYHADRLDQTLEYFRYLEESRGAGYITVFTSQEYKMDGLPDYRSLTFVMRHRVTGTPIVVELTRGVLIIA